MPARFNARSVANNGSSSMITGSPAVTVRFTTRASGVSPKRLSAASLATITPDAPSVIWLALAAVMVPPSSSVLTCAICSGVPPRRTPSSVSNRPSGVSTATISALKAPPSIAAAALAWLASA